jgi:hypothetical protein
LILIARNAYALANLAEVAAPDAGRSPGATWLRRVADAARCAWEADPDVCVYQDGMQELADGLVPVYTAELWAVFVDLALYQEDLSDWGPPSEPDMTRLASLACYEVATRLIGALGDEYAQDDE